MRFRRPSQWWLLYCLLVPATPFLYAQDSNAAGPTAGGLAQPSLAEKWNVFGSETMSPMTLVTAVPQAIASQLTGYAPMYGKYFRAEPFAERFAATVGDGVSRNFFADFALASALHEDTRYVREGPGHGVWHRIGYAISRAVITRTDSGASTFNWANVAGSAMSAGLSNAYYPPTSRTAGVAAVSWGTDIGGAGLTNLAPEFGSDIGRWLRRHLPFHH